MFDGSIVKNLPTMQETQELRVWSLGREDPLEVEMATHSSILDWKKSHGQRSLVGYSPWGHKRVRQDLATQQKHSLFNCYD